MVTFMYNFIYWNNAKLLFASEFFYLKVGGVGLTDRKGLVAQTLIGFLFSFRGLT